MQYDNSDSTPSMAFNVLASYANAWKFNSRPSAAVTALKIIPCFSCSSLTTDIARQLATVRGRYRGFGFAQLWRSAGLLADDFDSAGFGPSFVIRARWIGPSSLRVPWVHFCTFGWNQIPGCRVWALGAGRIAGYIVLSRQYFVRQATALLQFAKETTNPELAAVLIEKAADLKSQIDESGMAPDPGPQTPDAQPES